MSEAIQRLDLAEIMASVSIDSETPAPARQAGMRTLLDAMVDRGELDAAEDVAFLIAQRPDLARAAGTWFAAVREVCTDLFGPLAERALSLEATTVGALSVFATAPPHVELPPPEQWGQALTALVNENIPPFDVRASTLGTPTRFGGRRDCEACQGTGALSGEDCACVVFLSAPADAVVGNVIEFVDESGSHLQWGRIRRLV
jgi:hypothetical protein